MAETKRSTWLEQMRPLLDSPIDWSGSPDVERRADGSCLVGGTGKTPEDFLRAYWGGTDLEALAEAWNVEPIRLQRVLDYRINYRSGGPRIDWSRCPLAESVPGRLSGKPTLAGTRVAADSVVEAYEEGASAEEIAGWYGLDPALVGGVIDYALPQLEEEYGHADLERPSG